MVMVEEAPELPGMALAGENRQLDRFGNPEQESATRLLYAPPREVRLMARVADFPR
jgi:hypothetical protein